jgi:hypothetical protein
MYLVHWEGIHFPKEEEQGAGGGLEIVDSIAKDMDTLSVGTPRATASLEYIKNFEVGQAEDVGQADDDLPDYDDA